MRCRLTYFTTVLRASMDSHLFLPRSALFMRDWAVRTLMGGLLCIPIFSGLNQAQAVTLSRPVIESQLGQPLKVSIDLGNISPEESVDLQATFADPDSYKTWNVNINPALDQAKLGLLTRPDGTSYIRIEGVEPVTESFIEILINLKWATGSILRDFGFFLKNPNLDKPQTQSNPVLSGSELQVNEGDTASKIALQTMDHSQLSLDQMLVALLQSNPNAFIKNNVNLVKAGAKLNIPTTKDALAVDKDQAKQTVLLQAEEFANYKAQLANQLPLSQNKLNDKKVGGRINGVVRQGKAPAKDQLKLSTPEVKSTSKEPTAEEKIAQQKQVEENKERNSDVTKNIDDLNQLAKSMSLDFNPGGLFSGLPALQKINNLNDLIAWGKTNVVLTCIAFVLVMVILALIWITIKRARKPVEVVDPEAQSHTPPEFVDSAILKNANIASNGEHTEESNRPLNIEELTLLEGAPSMISPDHAHEGEDPNKMQFNFDLDLQSNQLTNSEFSKSGESKVSTDSSSNDGPYLKSSSTPVLMPAPVHALNDTLNQPSERPANSHSSDTYSDSHEFDSSNETEDPFKVRLDLAEELWKLGQKHTGRALAQEVAEQASPKMQERAKQWLSEHT